MNSNSPGVTGRGNNKRKLEEKSRHSTQPREETPRQHQKRQKKEDDMDPQLSGDRAIVAARSSLQLPAATESDATAKKCAGCRGDGHVLRDCVMPSLDTGCIGDCPFCNCDSHPIHECDKVLDMNFTDESTAKEFLSILLGSRARKPQFADEVFSWLDWLEYPVGDEDKNTLAGPYLPWTTAFAMRVAVAEPNDAIFLLKAYVHPKKFEHGSDTSENLSRRSILD